MTSCFKSDSLQIVMRIRCCFDHLRAKNELLQIDDRSSKHLSAFGSFLFLAEKWYPDIALAFHCLALTHPRFQRWGIEDTVSQLAQIRTFWSEQLTRPILMPLPTMGQLE